MSALGIGCPHNSIASPKTNSAALEFHGTEIHSGKKQWRGIPRETRNQAYAEALTFLTKGSNTRLFCAAVHRGASGVDDPMELAFEHVASRFDRMLGRFHKNGNTQRGLIILDESAYETSLQALAAQFRFQGHKWGQLYNLAEVPLFVNSKATRMIQYADLVAHASRRYFELGDASYFDIIKNSFDSLGGERLGLVHRVPPGEQCPCISCFGRSTHIHRPDDKVTGISSSAAKENSKR